MIEEYELNDLKNFIEIDISVNKLFLMYNSPKYKEFFKNGLLITIIEQLVNEKISLQKQLNELISIRPLPHLLPYDINNNLGKPIKCDIREEGDKT